MLYRLELAAGETPVASDDLSANNIPRISLDDEEALHALAPDVILDLSGNHGAGISAASARHGVWFTDAFGSVPGIAGLQPLLEGRPVSSINLFRRSLAQALPDLIASAAVNIKFVASRNERFLAEKSVSLILRELKRRARGLLSATPSETVLFVAPRAPGTSETLAYLGRMVGELVRRAWQKFATTLGLRPGMFCINLTEGEPLKFNPALAEAVTSPANCYYADPFLWPHGEDTWCFFESFDYHMGLGYISAGRIENGRFEDVRTVLAPGYHLSFPFLFEHDGQLFMMPESCASRRIELWRCTSFPDGWELHRTALEGTNASDSTLVQIDEQWWLFTNISDDPFADMSSELHLFRANSPLLERLEPHPLNPVVFDSRCARNAGRIWQRDGVFYRPAQDNSHGTYGYGLQLMRIDELTMERYRESSVRHITPNFKRGIIGCHHIDVLDNRIVFDVRHRYGGRG
ncbi:hypothetical protein DXH95_07760 [Sphingorhabdus pulchriflava]|uniref:Glucosamine inositolphosphorylceramide transferase 1 N-terminal domain-containing protein n=1 Tax=Sphingorhabdus pulchriflava TaxID=2292257 RepID=A0A371BIS7_9SPHN|nr:hypothetical protein DXH95_07760 [Sphingorhabdus pulchriflava]